MSLQNVQAQLGNLLAAMPLKLQKVSSSFLDSVDPPFEGAIASDSDGQFYVSQVNSGELVWQQIVDKSARDAAQGVSDSEFIGSFSLPVGLDSSTISYGKTLQGSKFSVFVQYEPPENSDVMYIFSVKNITNQQFDLMMSDDIKEEGGKIHIFARGYDQSSAGSMDVVYPPVEPMSPADYTVTGHAGNVGNIFDGDLEVLGGNTKLNSSSDFLAEWKFQPTDREWGLWKVLADYKTVKVKELVVAPNSTLSWQSHENRNELWFIREGTATIYYSSDDKGKDVFVTTKVPNDTFMINKRKWHQLANETEESVSVIEIQYGDECVEHDILRAVRPTRGILPC